MEIEVFFEENLKVNAKVGDHIIKTDQPTRSGGDNTAPAPFELFLASLATCSGIYVKQFCANREIETKDIRIFQRHTFDPETHMITHIEIEVVLPKDFPEKYRDAIVKVVDKCAVKRHITNAPEFSVKTTI